MKHNLKLLIASFIVFPMASASDENKAVPGAEAPVGFTWPSEVPEDSPFPRSTALTGIHFTGRHSDYKCGDAFYPSWAIDGNLYSPWTDGKTDGVECGSVDRPKVGARTGHAIMIGEDP